MIYTITLNPALDYVMKIDSLNTRDINRASDEKIYFGGKGINVSAVLTTLGAENKALGFLAGFTGKELERLLNEEKIENDFIFLENGNTRINVKIKAEKELDFNAQGLSITENDIQSLLTKLDEIKENDYLVLAGSIPSNLPNNIYEQILERLNGKGINFVVDATGELLLNVLKYKPFLIKPNHHELGDLFDVEIENEEDVIKYAKELQKLGAKNVLVSRSKDGATLVNENGNAMTIGNIEGKVVNSVGCGDSMVAGFIAGYIKENNYEHALKLGSACGNATALLEGLATKDEIERVMTLL